MAEKTERVLFEEYEFDIYGDWNQMLTIIYGDYMKLPPENERVCKHNPVKLQF